MTHDNDYYFQLMSASLDNELSPVQQQELDDFLAANPDIRAEFDDLAQANTMIGDFLDTANSELHEFSVWDAIADKIKPDAEAPEETTVNTKVVPFYKRRGTWISSALAASIMIFFGFYLFIFSNKPYNEQNNTCIVESVESDSSSVMVFKDTDTNTTIIWMFSAAPSDGRTNS